MEYRRSAGRKNKLDETVGQYNQGISQLPMDDGQKRESLERSRARVQPLDGRRPVRNGVIAVNHSGTGTIDENPAGRDAELYTREAKHGMIVLPDECRLGVCEHAKKENPKIRTNPI